MTIRLLTARQAAAALRGTPYYGYGQAPGYRGNTPYGVARLLIRVGGEAYYLQGEITADRRINSYFPNMYGGIVPLQASFEHINQAFRMLDGFAAGEVYQLTGSAFFRAIDRPVLTGGLSAAILPLPESHDAYLKAIGDKSRNMVRKPGKLGFSVRQFDKNDFLDDIFAVNTSLEVRQDQPLQPHYKERLYANYRKRKAWELVTEEWWGAFSPENRLVAYIYLPGTHGEYLTSRIMGHGDYLRFGVMNALVSEVVKAHAGECGHILYGMYEHGTDGLRRFKDSMGFAPVKCERIAFGPGSPRARVWLGGVAAANSVNTVTLLRDWSKRYPALRARLLRLRAALQLLLRRRT